MSIQNGIGLAARRSRILVPQFWRGINMNGAALSIDGNNWIAMSSALSQGLSISSYSATSNGIALSPSTDTNRAAMIRSVIFTTGTILDLNQSVPTGDYDVFLYLMEDFANNHRSLNLDIQNTRVASNIGSLPLGGWQRYGGYRVNNASTINIKISRASGAEPVISGLELWQLA